MQTAFRIKKRIDSTASLNLNFPELELLKHREVEIIILVDGKIEDGTNPPKALQNSKHAAGSFILDKEAMEQILDNRLR
ncbi:hypothetical protein CHISP_2690 [Chitinispirillum alkaliphilum]|nr:hypothetical protein CHISP_2690 [Chitinispirillum alkaliphilum]